MYDIEIDYTTGDSFGRERQHEELCNPTKSLDTAKENLKRIKEHYVKRKDDPDVGEYHPLILLTDDGEHTISPFWIGYFETLHGAKVITVGDDDMYFEL